MERTKPASWCLIKFSPAVMVFSIVCLPLQSFSTSLPKEANPISDVWVEAEGYTPFGEDTTLARARILSRDDARRRAVEHAVGTFIERQTVIYNFQLAEDLIRSVVRGIITDEHILSEGAVTEQQNGPVVKYVTKIRAKIHSLPSVDKNRMFIKAELNKSVYNYDEEMEIQISSSDDLYLHIFNVAQDDVITELLPNKYMSENKIVANKPYIFPSEKEKQLGLTVRAFPPQNGKTSIEKIKIIGTRKNIDLSRGHISQALFNVYPSKDKSFITDLLKQISLLDPSEWTEVTLGFEIREM